MEVVSNQGVYADAHVVLYENLFRFTGFAHKIPSAVQGGRDCHFPSVQFSFLSFLFY